MSSCRKVSRSYSSKIAALTLIALSSVTFAQNTPVGVPLAKPQAPAAGGVVKVGEAQSPLPQVDQSAWPLKFDTATHDFGTISDEKSVSFKFTFKNTGLAPVNITNIRTSCGCSAATADNDKRNYAPGESGAITITFDPRGRRGEERKLITIETDSKTNPNIELNLRSLVLPRLLVEPSTIYFGEVPIKEQGRTQEFSITSRVAGFEVTKIVANHPEVKIETLGKDQVDIGGEKVDRLKFRVSMPNNLPLDHWNGVLTITTNDKTTPSMTVPMLAIVVGELKLQPPRILVRMSGPNQGWNGEAVVMSRDNQAFSILGVEPVGTPEEMKIIVDVITGGPKVSNSYRIRAAGVSPRLITDIKGSIRVMTDRKEMPSIDIPLMGMWTGQMMPQNIPGVGGGPKQ